MPSARCAVGRTSNPQRCWRNTRECLPTTRPRGRWQWSCDSSRTTAVGTTACRGSTGCRISRAATWRPRPSPGTGCARSYRGRVRRSRCRNLRRGISNGSTSGCKRLPPARSAVSRRCRRRRRLRRRPGALSRQARFQAPRVLSARGLVLQSSLCGPHLGAGGFRADVPVAGAAWGFDRVMIWPMLESIPAPLSAADAAAVRRFRATIEDCAGGGPGMLADPVPQPRAAGGNRGQTVDAAQPLSAVEFRPPGRSGPGRAVSGPSYGPLGHSQQCRRLRDHRRRPGRICRRETGRFPEGLAVGPDRNRPLRR